LTDGTRIPIRTITLNLGDRHPVAGEAIGRAGSILRSAESFYATHGYESQTVRLSMRSALRDLIDWSPRAILDYAEDLEASLRDAGLAMCSLGTASFDIPTERMALLGDLLVKHDMLSASVELASLEAGIRPESALAAAGIIKRLSEETSRSFGTFRFTAVALLGPGSPFFPGAYHSSDTTSFSIGLQGAGVVADAARRGANSPGTIAAQVGTGLASSASRVVDLATDLAREIGIGFGGIDLSPAPLGDDSIGGALEDFAFGKVGSPGTITLVAALTDAIKMIDLPKCGYNGLMLPILEDAVLARRWSEGCLDVHKLLLYSAVCGTGLDTIPLPGNLSEGVISRLLMDVATLADRLTKPLSARLMPIAGKKDGEVTTFAEPYISNAMVRHPADPENVMR
jgi:uncharacterized protein (UPF0210 family)